MNVRLFGSFFCLFFFGAGAVGEGLGVVNLIMLKLKSCRLSLHFVSLQVGDAEAAAKA